MFGLLDWGGAERKLTITDCTQGTIDFTVPDEVPAGTYRLEARSRAKLLIRENFTIRRRTPA